MTENSGAAREPWWKNWKIWAVIVGVLLVIGMIQNVVNPDGGTAASDDEPVAGETVVETVAEEPTEEVVVEESEGPPMSELVTNAVLMDGAYDSFQGACADGINWICQISEIKPGPNTGDVEVHAVAGEAGWEDIIRGVANFSCAAGVKPDWIIVYQAGVVQEQERAGSFSACRDL